EREASTFAAGVELLLQNVIKTLDVTSFMSLSATIVLGVVSAFIMYLGAHVVLNHTMTIGTFVTYILYLGMMVRPMTQIVGIGTELSEAMAGLERTREVLSEKPEDDDPRRSVTLGTVNGDIRFENVSFAYQKGKPVLHSVSFKSQPGSITALVGSSGSGKSTIIGLISAFYSPTEGVITVDGIDLSSVRLDSYRTQLGVVLQESFLFDGTIRENVAFSRPDATEAEILEACRIARVDEFAETFDRGYDTVVGERGVKLSGGQRQRVSIARAILANPRILILDEATSSLDSESESQIQEGLSYLLQGRTTFVIAHRLSTVRKADQILVIEGGRVVERGTHASLYAAGGRYYDLYTRQHGIEANILIAPGERVDEAEPIGSPAVGATDGEAPDAGPMDLLRSREA
ncbi:MAG: ABC transporter ATP-binding protein, partial [Acidobacteriota bacterium]|nr:ABC transporter ATP-binding protein [Acidobacteriota bacterium]